MLKLETTDDAKNLRLFATDRNLDNVDRFFMSNLISRNVVLGNLTQTQVDSLTVLELADVLEYQVS